MLICGCYRRQCYDSRMRFGFRCVCMAAMLSVAIAAEVAAQENAPNRQYADAAEAFQRAISREPSSPDTWRNWADFSLGRFRILDLQLRGTQSGMAVVLRLKGEGLQNETESREALLRRSATADPEQAGIWGELGVEQMRRGMRKEAAASLKIAQDHQPSGSWTLQLEAMMAAAQGNWKEAGARLFELGGHSPAVFQNTMQAWPRDLLPPKEVSGALWDCMRSGSTACLQKIDFPQGEVPQDEEQLFAQERWERLAAQP